MLPPERVEARALDTLTDGVRTARLRLLLLLLILLLRSCWALLRTSPLTQAAKLESESPASEGGQGMADPLNNLGAEPTHAG